MEKRQLIHSVYYYNLQVYEIRLLLVLIVISSRETINNSIFS